MQLSSMHGAKLPHNFLPFCLYLFRPVDELRKLCACTWLTEGATSLSTVVDIEAAGAVPAEAEVDAEGAEGAEDAIVGATVVAVVLPAGRFGTTTGTLGLEPNGRVVSCRVVSCGSSSAA